MFARKMKLQCKLRQLDNDLVMAIGSIYDGTPFEVQVDKNDIIVNDDFHNGFADGWLFVQEEAKQADRSYLTLPKPSIQFGRQVVVNKHQLLPINVTLKDFGPKTS